ncbi:hypothetical protein COCSUDRAFT_55813 [Coccomyxa subellipsoidea C-169]|uniref:Uncharacterized protein n=1 Tax=Coccomyxa subellipsoidea (strain C-169) TaxID=574566 RepID=I0YUP6_COCSC|nr:hypothetical protein COCSUDRAFT_55813 [Coccomyxa subellipsoidea C-169]EIE22115.1 hypothetical protein COCSUDRAFT_55813 [Coccomyxa subellipsoidea C-169]|eukprot:XP_005646659.1 hypothetical protein COCSUDRAFT_55813 [Coccomyxa subellipsoidea C-169]
MSPGMQAPQIMRAADQRLLSSVDAVRETFGQCCAPARADAGYPARRAAAATLTRRPQDSASPLIRLAYKPGFRERSDSPGAASAQMQSGHRENGTGDGCQTWLS